MKPERNPWVWLVALVVVAFVLCLAIVVWAPNSYPETIAEKMHTVSDITHVAILLAAGAGVAGAGYKWQRQSAAQKSWHDTQARQCVLDRYKAKFGDLRDIGLPPAIWEEDAFYDLVEKAIETGKPLTLQAIETKLGLKGFDGEVRD